MGILSTTQRREDTEAYISTLSCLLGLENTLHLIHQTKYGIKSVAIAVIAGE